MSTNIDNIRLEFKVVSGDTLWRISTSINRIRLEFKGLSTFVVTSSRSFVLIESDWNLKDIRMKLLMTMRQVLIESDWNLKIILSGIVQQDSSVLIESDWNLKVFL